MQNHKYDAYIVCAKCQRFVHARMTFDNHLSLLTLSEKAIKVSELVYQLFQLSVRCWLFYATFFFYLSSSFSSSLWNTPLNSIIYDDNFAFNKVLVKNIRDRLLMFLWLGCRFILVLIFMLLFESCEWYIDQIGILTND